MKIKDLRENRAGILRGEYGHGSSPILSRIVSLMCRFCEHFAALLIGKLLPLGDRYGLKGLMTECSPLKCIQPFALN